MKQRFITGFFIFLATVLIVAAKFLPHSIGDYIFDIFIVLLTIVAAFEMCKIMDKLNKPVNLIMGSMYAIFNCAIVLFLDKNVYTTLLVQFASLLIYFVIILIVELITNRKNINLSTIFKRSLNTIIVCIYPSFLFCLFILLNHMDTFSGAKYFSVVLILFVFAITMLSDTCAYLVGRTFKGPKLAPKISPNKTISGGIGGLLGGLLGSMLIYALVINISSWSIIVDMFSLSWWHFALIGIFGSAISQCGDLFESLLKRKANIKDSGHILPGHGGMLDRIDAMIFCTTFIFIISLIII